MLNNISYELIHHLDSFIDLQNSHINMIQNTSLDKLSGTGIIDMLLIRTHNYNKKAIKKYWKLNKTSRNIHFPNIKVYRHNSKKHLGLKAEFKLSSKENSVDTILKTKHKYVVGINPSRYKSLNDLLKTLKQILGEHYSTAIITRMDFSVLLNKNFFPIDFFYLFLSVPRKSIGVSYTPSSKYKTLDKGDLKAFKSGYFTGLEYGVYPKRLIIYDVKTYNQSKNTFKRINIFSLTEKYIENFKNELTPHGESIINLEYQISDKILFDKGIKSIESLKYLPTLKPFPNLKLFNPFNLKTKITKKRTEIQLSTLIRGYHQTRVYVSQRDNKFYRQEKDAFTKVHISKDKLSISKFLNHSFQMGMKKYCNL